MNKVTKNGRVYLNLSFFLADMVRTKVRKV